MKSKDLSKQFIIGAFIFFHSLSSFAQTNYLNNTTQNVMSDSSIQYEVCGTVTQTVFNPLTQKNETKQVVDQACVNRNNQKRSVQNQVIQGATAAATLNDSNSTGIKAPTAPVLADCGSQTTQNGFYNSAYSTCQQRNAALQNDYNYKMDIYNRAMAQTASSKASESDQDLYGNMSDTTATGGLDEIQKKNEDGNMLYTAAAAALQGLAVTNFIKEAACESSCPSGCCSAAPAFGAAAAAFMLLNGQSNKQADEHEASAYQACTAYNQLSSTQKTCTPPATTTKYTRPEGCTSINVADCQGAGSELNGLNGKTKSGGVSSFISPELNKYGEILPDGSVKTKDGKVFKLSDFADKNSLMAKGFTAAQAQSILDQVNAKNGILAKTDLDAKGQLKGLNSAYGSGAGSGGGTKIVDISTGADSGKLYKDKLNGLNDDEKNRKPSSEGLAKEFNGELIGVANDDIFLMMNRRYKRIGDQDTLITP